MTRCFAARGSRSFAHRFARRKANGVAEQFVRTVRSECLDWLLVLNRAHLHQVLRVFGDHYIGHRPHRALCLTPPKPTSPAMGGKERRSGPATRPTAWCDSRGRRRGVTQFVNRTPARLVPCLCLGKGVCFPCIAFLSTAAPRRGIFPDLSNSPHQSFSCSGTLVPRVPIPVQ